MKLQRFLNFLSRPHKNRAQPLAHWFRTAKGQLLGKMERELLEAQLVRHFGSYILHYNPVVPIVAAPSIRQSVSIGDPQINVEMQCTENKWPVAADAVDVVVLQHSLDFARSPHDVLREAAHCVRPGGHLIIVGSHTWSLFGVYRFLSCNVWKDAHYLAPARITDWLSVLGFSVEKRCYAAYIPLLTASKLQNKLARLEHYAVARQLPLGGCYMLVARKMVHGMHPKMQSSKVALQKLRTTAVTAHTPYPKNFKHSEEYDR
ncbi:methyltransferase domain-containing protein [Denitrificimonas sp. JX-1]|uniref:Methyltransferase domain-containing protein n=1 Tax=Denitrificimonas halotolerans TaxID=3098930 RepID=A0ABU5GV53_9GAMM|nr:methyltransferase domain-containing protein [Denitrificimonas sp. JX-1]MDY7220397.1 methyltransferase domain-containing protein [Denitrificimonas sp. JX-1]